MSFAPRSSTCAVGVLSPGSLPAAPPPADGSQNAVLTVSVRLSTAKGLFVPVAGVNVNLLRKNLKNTLKEIGFQLAPGRSMVERFLNCDDTPDCQKASDAVHALIANFADSGKDGKATFPAVPPGTYYLMGGGAKMLWWDVKVDLRQGANAVHAGSAQCQSQCQ